MPKQKLFKLMFILSCLGIMVTTQFHPVHAQEAILNTDSHELVKAKVVEVLHKEDKLIPGTSVNAIHQTLSVEILEGSRKSQIISVENDRLNLESKDIFYLQINSYSDGSVTYAVAEPYRMVPIIVFAIIFVLLVILFGGIQGIRGLLSLAGSLLVLFYLFLPELLAGRSPIIMSLLVASLIIVLGSYITHGFNKTTSAAVVGMIVTVLFTGVMAIYAVSFTKLTGFSSEDVVYLHFNTDGKIDMVGLLLGGILIGLLGVLYDAAIGQAVAIEELATHAPHLTRRKLFERAIRIGREHIGALINTLALAYVGASLPLLLLFYSSSGASLMSILNREDFATEIMRTIIGSIGLILAVPITSLVAVLMLKKKDGHKNVHKHSNGQSLALMKEKGKTKHGHSHSHIHSHISDDLE